MLDFYWRSALAHTLVVLFSSGPFGSIWALTPCLQSPTERHYDPWSAVLSYTSSPPPFYFGLGGLSRCLSNLLRAPPVRHGLTWALPGCSLLPVHLQLSSHLCPAHLAISTLPRFSLRSSQCLPPVL